MFSLQYYNYYYCRLKSGQYHSLKPGDKVLFYNPERVSRKHTDPFSPRNVIGEIIDVVPGGLCKVSYGDNETTYKKNIFIGQLVKWEEEEIDIDINATHANYYKAAS